MSLEQCATLFRVREITDDAMADNPVGVPLMELGSRTPLLAPCGAQLIEYRADS